MQAYGASGVGQASSSETPPGEDQGEGWGESPVAGHAFRLTGITHLPRNGQRAPSSTALASAAGGNGAVRP